MRLILITVLLGTLGTTLWGASFQDDFAVVFIDAASEAKYGTFPLDRPLLARAIQKAGELQARGVVLKFFFDLPKGEAGDNALAQSLTNLPVVLQARMDNTTTNPNPLPARFTLTGVAAQTE